MRTCARILYAVLRSLVPSNSRRIGFVSSPDLADNAMALFEAIMESPQAKRFRLLWLVQDVPAAARNLNRMFPGSDLKNVYIVKKNSLRGLWVYLRCRYIFTTHGTFWFVGVGFRQVIVNLWHGMPLKKICAFEGKGKDDLAFMHYSIASSDFFADIVARALWLSANRVLVSGLPRCEWLFQPEERYSALRENRSSLVVWLPTFRTSFQGEIRQDSAGNAQDPLDMDGLTELDAILDGMDSLLLIKLHLMDAKNRQIWPAFRNIRIYGDARFQNEGFNLYKLLACSDALVTDFSSCVFDYLPLRRPIGIFAPDRLAYSRGFIPEVLNKSAAIGCQLGSIEELGAFVRNLPPLQAGDLEMEDLYRSDLRNPSQIILRAVGLQELA